MMKHRLKEIIAARGLTVRPLAKDLGEDYTEVSRVINGQRKLTIEWLLKFSKALNLSPNEIVDIDLGLPSTCDQALLGSVIGFVFNACDEVGVTLGPKELASWISFIYNDTVRHDLSVEQTKELAFSIVKTTQKQKGAA
ncbi:MAG: helix-turn-helix transcriptional regulator [Alphaproteobacteria bacterium]|jgi:DNA-binding Xre family transcriptional regulator|nr:helix-turn-helix transcriptional regulator [Alphaproteobacteria bacterium]